MNDALKNGIIITTAVILLGLVIMFGLGQKSILNVNSKYYVGDTVSFDIAALSTNMRGIQQACTFTYYINDVEKKAVGDRFILGGVSAYRVTIPSIQAGTYIIEEGYASCPNRIDSTGKSLGAGIVSNNEQKSFTVVDKIATQTHAYYACGDSTGTSLDIYWFNSAGVREDLKQDCGLQVGSACTGGVNSATCSGTRTTTTDSVKSHDHSLCYNNDVYWFTNFNIREELKQDCTSGCSNGVCSVSAETVLACVPNKDYGTKCGVNNDAVTLTCNIDGLGYSQKILLCGDSECVNGACSEQVEVVDTIDECKAIDGSWIDNYCVTSSIIIEDLEHDASDDSIGFWQKLWNWILNLFRVN